MIFKLRTSKETMEIFQEIGNSLYLQPFILAKIAIALSIKSKKNFQAEDFKTDNDGLELNRQTITGDYDELFKALIISRHNKNIEDSEYFPKYIKAHLDRGSKMLLSEYRYNPNNFYRNILNLDANI
ncbi:MAG TPA: DndE family protein [Acholeplasma sp.]|nr:DndE family protein [Acholeplasma sp.]